MIIWIAGVRLSIPMQKEEGQKEENKHMKKANGAEEQEEEKEEKRKEDEEEEGGLHSYCLTRNFSDLLGLPSSR